jgi:hypothetical protein
VAVDPYIVEGGVPIVAHPALPYVPVGGVGAGLTPGEAISVEPSGSPVPPTVPVGTMPSGEVAESDGVGVTAACAKAGLASSGQAAAITRRRFMTHSIS